MSSHAIPVGAVKGASAPVNAAPGKTIYTCPMHPEVRQDRPGPCPKCGMALEPVTPAGGASAMGTDAEESGELRNMTRRFWIGAALTLRKMDAYWRAANYLSVGLIFL